MSGLSILCLIFHINKLPTKQKIMQITSHQQNSEGMNIQALRLQQ